MKTYNIYFSDYPNSPLKVWAKNKTDARIVGGRYNRMWSLEATILRIEEVQEDVVE